ncbi:hypothetical protein NEOC65_001560 [Neochlamydia sp. AcF65]|nr:hypothetical protein [Neochlamydia sp. AcF65]
MSRSHIKRKVKTLQLTFHVDKLGQMKEQICLDYFNREALVIYL